MIWGRRGARAEIFFLANQLMGFFLPGGAVKLFFLDFAQASPWIINGSALKPELVIAKTNWEFSF